MRKKFSLSIISIFVVSLLIIQGCGKEEKAKTIEIGAILPLTGELSFFGEADRNALTLFAEENPDVHFVFEDSRGTAKDGLAAANKLVAQNVRYFITSLSFIVNTIQPVINEHKVLNFTLNMDPRSEELSNYCMRLYVTFYDEMDKLIQLVENNEFKSVAVLYVNVETMNNAVENYLRNNLEKNGVNLYTETYDIGTRSFRDNISRLSKNVPEVVRILDFGDKLNIILKQISELRAFNEASFIVSGIETLLADYRNFPIDLIDKFLFTTPEILFKEDNPVVKSYYSHFGSYPHYDAMFAYDMANILVPVIRIHGYNNVSEVIKSLIDKKTYKGVAANYSINKNGGISPIIFWATIKNGEIIFKR